MVGAEPSACTHPKRRVRPSLAHGGVLVHRDAFFFGSKEASNCVEQAPIATDDDVLTPLESLTLHSCTDA